jgi:hypothetical protein
MKMFLAFVISSALVQQADFTPLPVSQVSHRPVVLGTTVHVSDTSSGSAFSDLVAVGLENHIPLGITLMDTPNSDICRVPLNLKQGTMTVAELIHAIEEVAPGYQVQLQKGVLDVTPGQLPDSTTRFLEMKLAHFQSAPETHQDIGYDLWRPIFGILAPGAGTNSSHLTSLSAERVPAMDVRDETVESILNLIVDSGGGGVWVLRTSQLKTLSAETPMPYEIHGYTGDHGSIAANLTCSK